MRKFCLAHTLRDQVSRLSLAHCIQKKNNNLPFLAVLGILLETRSDYGFEYSAEVWGSVVGESDSNFDRVVSFHFGFSLQTRWAM